MKKTTFSKVVAVLSSVALLSATAVIGASAAATDDIALTLSSVEVKAGETATIEVAISGNPGITGTSFTLNYDEDLSEPTINGTGVLKTVDPYAEGSVIAITAYNSATNVYAEDGAFATLSFDIPEDAEVGTQYTIAFGTITSVNDASTRTEYSTSVDSASVGVITVVGEETTTEETTTEATTTTEAATTTATSTTTAAAVKTSPKTGSTGIVATAAVLLAAACSAVVFKKKKD